MTTTQIEEIKRHLNEIQLVCDDGRMPQKLCDQIMEHQRAITVLLDTDAEKEEEDDDAEEEEED